MDIVQIIVEPITPSNARKFYYPSLSGSDQAKPERRQWEFSTPLSHSPLRPITLGSLLSHLRPGPDPGEVRAVQPLRRSTVAPFNSCTAFHEETSCHLAELQLVHFRHGANRLALGHISQDPRDSNHASRHSPKYSQTWRL